jgi:hypothetical protein
MSAALMVRRSRDCPFRPDDVAIGTEHRFDDGGFCGVCGADLCIVRRVVSKPCEVSFADRLRAKLAEMLWGADECGLSREDDRIVTALGLTEDERDRLVDLWVEACATAIWGMCGLLNADTCIGVAIAEDGTAEFLYAANDQAWIFA